MNSFIYINLTYLKFLRFKLYYNHSIKKKVINTVWEPPPTNGIPRKVVIANPFLDASSSSRWVPSNAVSPLKDRATHTPRTSPAGSTIAWWRPNFCVWELSRVGRGHAAGQNSAKQGSSLPLFAHEPCTSWWPGFSDLVSTQTVELKYSYFRFLLRKGSSLSLLPGS